MCPFFNLARRWPLLLLGITLLTLLLLSIWFLEPSAPSAIALTASPIVA